MLIENATVGRLHVEDAAALCYRDGEAREAGGVATCRALIRGGWDRGRDNVGLFGVVLCLRHPR